MDCCMLFISRLDVVKAFLKMEMPLLWYNENFDTKRVDSEMYLKFFGLGG